MSSGDETSLHWCQDHLPNLYHVPAGTIAACERCGRYWRLEGTGLLTTWGWYPMFWWEVWWARRRGRIPRT